MSKLIRCDIKYGQMVAFLHFNLKSGNNKITLSLLIKILSFNHITLQIFYID